jgi:uncharacterized protein (UPF0332 family)
VKPQSAAFLEKSRQFLAKAQELLDSHRWPDEAGRAAYLAGFHAAQAFIFESTGKAARRHGGVQRQFACLVKNDSRFDVELRTFLPRAYNFKAIADYQTGPGSQISAAGAREAIAMARRFVQCVASLIPPND